MPGSPFPGGSAPLFLKVDVNDKYAYGLDAHTVRQYTVDPVSGALSFVDSWVLPGFLPYPTGLDIDPAGKFMVVEINNTGEDNIVGFEIAPLTGSLTPVVGSPFTDLNKHPASVAFDPSGKFVYITNAGQQTGNVTGYDNTVAGYAVESSNGSLTAISGSPFISRNHR